MPIVYLLFGMVLGFGIAYTRCYAIDQENRSLRDTLQHLRTMAQLGDRRGIVKCVDRVLEQEVAA